MFMQVHAGAQQLWGPLKQMPTRPYLSHLNKKYFGSATKDDLSQFLVLSQGSQW